jgi:hypothetical protein
MQNGRLMSKVNISKAARLAGVSRATMYRKYIDNGVISIDSDREGNKVIDTSELVRVFGSLVDIDETPEHPDQSPETRIAALESALTSTKTALLKSEDEAAWLRELVNDLRQDIKLIAHQPTTASQPRKPWWKIW